VGFADVAAVPDRVAAGSSDLACHRLGEIGLASVAGDRRPVVAYEHPGTARSEPGSVGASYAASTSGDDDCATVESQFHRVPPLNCR
jgi:hypothetical protein